MDIRSFTRKDTATVPIQDPLGGKTDIVVRSMAETLKPTAPPL